VTTPYRATGQQLKIKPFATGLTWDQWIVRQRVATPKEIAEFMEKREKGLEKPEKPVKRHSGALPGNSEWL